MPTDPINLEDAAAMLKEVDHANRQYVMRAMDGCEFRCGFEESLADTRLLARTLGEELPPLELGQEEVLTQHTRLVRIICDEDLKLATWYGSVTAPELQKSMEVMRRTGEVVRLWYGDERGLWLADDLSSLYGSLDRSDGPLKVPTLNGAVVRLKYVAALAHWPDPAKPAVFLWTRPEFKLPNLHQIGNCAMLGEALARRCVSPDEARQWIAFMGGAHPLHL